MNTARIIYIMVLLLSINLNAQELYVMTEPASNMPSKSLGVRIGQMYMPPYINHENGIHNNHRMYRSNVELMYGINKFWMIHGGLFLSNYFQKSQKFEGFNFYVKNRFLSIDENHKHFRMAAFAKASVSNNPTRYEEVNLNGDNSGVGLGIIATELVNKLAVSTTLSYLKGIVKESSLNRNINDGLINLSLSTGYLFYPFHYKNYKETNVNFYVELLSKRLVAEHVYFIDVVPAVQFILNSSTKIDFAYRRQIDGNMLRMNDREFLVKLELNFFNVVN